MSALREAFQALRRQHQVARLRRRAGWLHRNPTQQPVVNEPLLRQVLIHIELFPQEWDQRTFASETAACLAGWAVVLGGAVDLRVVARLDGGVIFTLAKELLGLSTAQATALFQFCAVARRPAFAELCHRVHVVTGVCYKVTPELTEADYVRA